MNGKSITIIVGGGIAAYKSLELIRLFKKAGANVRAVLTRAGAEFVTPLSLSALTGEPVFENLFDLDGEAQMGHIQLSRAADLIIVAPATADLMAKMANGMANDLASTLLLATDTPVLIAPTMNVRMWDHAATRRNLATLKADGIMMVGPDEGDMACGEFGFGRLAEPGAIFAATAAIFGAPGPLSGKHILITSGPTHEPIDPVRYIANRSSGRQGAAIAEALAKRGAKVSYITGPVSIPAPKGVDLIAVETAKQMFDTVKAALPADIAIFAAAVADWRVEGADNTKIKKQKGALPSFTFAENPDILATISDLPKATRPGLVIGFAAETDHVLDHARAKKKRKNCDWLLANDVSGDVMGGADNQVILIRDKGEESWPLMSKKDVAERLAETIMKALKTS
ncbi:MAG: bifunctional phosphopantothenoylcysteine decarboxylase/phosphopantothenate--cysteine ligase CoaBC [Robiginitomaculum sp.]|nr:MAG: bifunctional phosphopantothenoylcysteine decarboxylase/phosphopantothenate--cysteine ligase CoaBC [Robiginitomaculum sp.]